MSHQRAGWVRPVILIGLLLAALVAPPSVFAETTPPVTPTPPPVPSPIPQPPLPQPPSEKPIRVGLGRSITTIDITAAGGLYVVGEGAIHWETPPNQVVKLTLQGDKIQVVGLAKLFTGTIRLIPRSGVTPNWVSFKGKTYRGEMQVSISPKDRKLSVVNLVNLEDYLQGVVPEEMSPSWPAEAIKAQAVAGRTFVLYNLGKYEAEGFDVDNTTSSQVYGGVREEDPRSTEAVRATKGQVVTFGGKVIGAYYHSSSGGHTEGNDVIWGSAPVAYLRGVPDYDNLPGNTRYAWTETINPEQVPQALTKGGPLRSVAPSGTIGTSGRPSRWSLDGALQATVMTGEQVRWALNLLSSPKSILLVTGGPADLTRSFNPADSVQVLGASGVAQPRVVQGTTVLGASGIQVVASGAAAQGTGSIAAGGIVVSGGGWGHGIGMSQWGAHGMALQGKTYTEILTHYYQGTKVENR